MLKIYETFSSIQGESTRAGIPCFFIRLAQCNLRCSYCDTKRAQTLLNSREMQIEDLLKQAGDSGLNLVEITGGEPMLQSEGVCRLAESLIRRVPGLDGAIDRYWTSTPATWERYTGTPGGTAFGIRKKDATCYVHPRTPVPGLYLTGQNCGLHGVLGVSETALVTCREILGESTLNQILTR